jgi:2-polyprenyl-3-methyl-5-hydroxy-6-metoxy-1,4-benzoquinol methylase
MTSRLVTRSIPQGGSLRAASVDLPENQWGYAKRLRFIQTTISNVFPHCEKSSVHVLDVGCGNGAYVAVPLARAGYRVTGLDLHQDSIEHAKFLAAATTNARFICADVATMPEKSFDVVILSEVLEHVADPQRLLEKSATRLNDNGVLIVTVPNGRGEFEIDSWIYRQLRLQRLVNLLAKPATANLPATDNLTCGHVQFFTLRRLRRIFGECSLSILYQGASSWLSGPIVGVTVARFPRFIAWNVKIADQLPMPMVSGWYFALRKQNVPD